jgi:hypothetical protein
MSACRFSGVPLFLAGTIRVGVGRRTNRDFPLSGLEKTIQRLTILALTVKNRAFILVSNRRCRKNCWAAVTVMVSCCGGNAIA